MQMNFPRPQMTERDINLQDYQHALFNHICYEKLRNSHDRYYLGVAAVFMLICLLLMHMQGAGVISNYKIGVVAIGIVTFAICIVFIKMRSEYDRKPFYHTCKVKKLEEKLISVVYASYFKAFDSLRAKWYMGILFLRIFPTITIGILTTITGITFSTQIELWLAMTIATVSVVILVMGLVLYLKNSRRYL